MVEYAIREDYINNGRIFSSISLTDDLDNNIKQLNNKIIYMNHHYSLLISHGFGTDFFTFKGHNLDHMIKCLDYKLSEMKYYSEVIKLEFIRARDMINTLETESSYKERLNSEIKFYALEGCKLDNLISEIGKIKLNLMNEYNQELVSVYLNKMHINELINLYREYLKTGVIPIVNNSPLNYLTLTDYVYLINNQENNSFIYLLEYKCFLFKNVNDLSSSISHYYFMCNEKVKLFNLLTNMKVNNQIDYNKKNFFSIENFNDKILLEKMLDSLKTEVKSLPERNNTNINLPLEFRLFKPITIIVEENNLDEKLDESFADERSIFSKTSSEETIKNIRNSSFINILAENNSSETIKRRSLIDNELSSSINRIDLSTNLITNVDPSLTPYGTARDSDISPISPSSTESSSDYGERSFFETEDKDSSLKPQLIINTSRGGNNFISKIKNLFGFRK